jgi:hypothetical protein
MAGCKMIKCPYFTDGKCHSPADYVDRDDGLDMCHRNSRAIPRDEYEGAKNTEQQLQPDSTQ